jgi:cbb3-type cytochrome oxidase subunit 3
MQTLFSGFIIQLIFSGLLFVLLIYFVLKNAKLKKEIDRAASASNDQEDK